ncbi:branched-chain-amino-acid transaminase [candidate division CSSED10-310 bacterium]|uniref:Branched-chain-amino-acid aminotransferase n=1 Tax=candidate division CSSED10-310 bacterium TaxID=2855610 RepID=A0ABV6YSQ4_UNCC1
MGTCIYINGEYYTDRDKACVSVFDHGYLYGDGVFEGIRVYDGLIFKCKEHINRLYESAKSLLLDIQISQAELTNLLVETVRRSELRDAYVRLVVSRGIGDLGLDIRLCKKPTVVIIVDKISLYPPACYENGLKVITTTTRRSRPDSLNCQIKSCNYLNNILAKIEVIRAGADEGIMLNDAGYVTEATADNIFIVSNDLLITPSHYFGILQGITRNTILRIALDMGLQAEVWGILVHDIYNAEECFLSGSAAEIIPVVECDGRVIADGKPGPIFKKLLGRFRETTKTEGILVYS